MVTADILLVLVYSLRVSSRFDIGFGICNSGRPCHRPDTLVWRRCSLKEGLLHKFQYGYVVYGILIQAW